MAEVGDCIFCFMSVKHSVLRFTVPSDIFMCRFFPFSLLHSICRTSSLIVMHSMLFLHCSVSSDAEGPLPITGNIPMDLSADDVLADPINLIAAVGMGGEFMSNTGGGNSSVVGGDRQGAALAFDAPSALVVEVLKELDKDYMALRSRLVSLIDQQTNSPKTREVEPEHAVQHSVALNDMVEKKEDEGKIEMKKNEEEERKEEKGKTENEPRSQQDGSAVVTETADWDKVLA